MAQRIGVVLAGGSGRRLGRSKGALRLDGVPLAERAARALHPVCGSVLVSLAPGVSNPAPDWPAVHDRPPGGEGPLAGIAAAFAGSRDADLLVLACDYPNVDTGLLRDLAARARADFDIVMPTDDAGRDHPLVAVWNRRMQRAVEATLKAGRRSVRTLFPDCRMLRLKPQDLPGHDLDDALHNVNWPEDLDAYAGD